MIIDCKNTDSQYINRTEVVEAYLRDIRGFNVLTPQEQKDLLTQSHSKDKKIRQSAINKLVETNQRFIVSFAKKWSNGNNLLDIINEANMGLIEAIDKFDVNSDNNFLTYAVWWIRKYVNEYRNDYDTIVKRPNAHRYNLYVPKARRQFITQHHREPTLEELRIILKEKYDFNVIALSDLEGVRPYMIDTRQDEDDINGSTETDSLFNEYTATNNISQDINDNYITDFVNFLMEKLSEKEQMVIRKNYGIGCEEESIDRIAEELGTSRHKVQQIIKKSHKKLQKYENFN